MYLGDVEGVGGLAFPDRFDSVRMRLRRAAARTESLVHDCPADGGTDRLRTRWVEARPTHHEDPRALYGWGLFSNGASFVQFHSARRSGLVASDDGDGR